MNRFHIYLFFLLMLFFSNRHLSQNNQLKPEIERALVIRIINKVNSLNSSINSRRLRRMNGNININNDLMWYNNPDSSVNYKNYLELIKKKTTKYISSIDIYDIEKSTYKKGKFITNVYVIRTVNQSFNDYSKLETIKKKIIFNSTLEEGYWETKIIDIKNINKGDRIVGLILNGSKHYFERYGAAFDFLDSSYLIKNKSMKNKILYFINDTQKPISYPSINSFRNYSEFYKKYKPEDSLQPRIAQLKLKNSGAGRYGYLEIGMSKDYILNTKTIIDSKFSVNNFNNTFNFTNNWNSSIDYHIYLKNPFRLYFGLGLNSNTINTNLKFDNFNQFFEDVDPDGASYIRNISYNNFQESNDIVFTSLPIKIGCAVELNKFLKFKNKSLKNNNILLDFNYSFSPIIAADSYSISNVNMLYSGYYQDLFNLTISQNGVYDYGNYNISNEFNSSLNKNFINNVGFGLKTHLNRFFISTNINYSWFQNDLYKNENFNYLSTNVNELKSFHNSFSEFNINMVSINLKVGWVLIKNKNEKF